MKSEDRDKDFPKRIAKTLMISVGIALLGTAIFLWMFPDDYNDPVLSEDYELGTYECDGWYDEINQLFKMNEPITNIDVWSQSHQNKYYETENRIMYHCTIQREDVLEKLGLCIETYSNIQRLIGKMEERVIDTLSEENQENYYGNRTKYFRNNCDLLQDDINATLNRN